MTRTTRNISLGLIGSALLATCCIGSGFLEDDDPQKTQGQPTGTTTVSHSTWRRSGFWPRSYWWSRPSYSYVPSSSVVGRGTGGTPLGGGSRSSPGGATSRGGFGGTGHATAGG